MPARGLRALLTRVRGALRTDISSNEGGCAWPLAEAAAAAAAPAARVDQNLQCYSHCQVHGQRKRNAPAMQSFDLMKFCNRLIDLISREEICCVSSGVVVTVVEVVVVVRFVCCC